MTMYGGFRDTYQRQERDRQTWAGDTQVTLRHRLTGRGETVLEGVNFGVGFQGPPFFSYGVELASGELIPTDFPFVTAGVSAWEVAETRMLATEPRYLGCDIYVVVYTFNNYDLTLTFSFEGVAFKNPEYTTE